MRKFLKGLFWLMSVIVYRIKINGKENIPEDGAALICPNHVHALDAVLVVVHAKRRINVLAKEELFEHRALRWLAKIFGEEAGKISNEFLAESAGMQDFALLGKIRKIAEQVCWNK